MRKPLGRPCAINECDRPVNKDGGYDMCGMHYQRLRNNGSPFIVRTGGGSLPAERNPNWSGDNASYAAIHIRLRRWRGSAKDHNCVDCVARAREWSYDHSDPDELVDSKYGRYSTDLDHYEPRCTSCHRLFDNAARTATGERP